MIIPPGFLFRPTDELLVSYYLGRKFMGLPLRCDLIIEREIYGVGDKAPWQIFTDQDPWEICKTTGKNGNTSKTEATIYVFTTLIKASKNRTARTAGCGVWHAETALEKVLDDHGHVIGHKRMLCFQITDEPGVIDGSVNKGHWIMHEYSRCGGKSDESQAEYVLCRIKRQDSKFTKKSKRVKNHEAPTDHDVIAPRPIKRVRTECVEEHKTVRDIDVMPFPEEVVVQEPSSTISDDQNGFTLEEFEALWEKDIVQGSHSTRMSDDSNDLIAGELEALTEEEKQGSNHESDLFHAAEEPSQGFSFSDLFLEFLAIWEKDRQGSYSPRMGDDHWNGLTGDDHWSGLTVEELEAHMEEPSPVFSFSNEEFLEQQKKDMSLLDPVTLLWLKNISDQEIPTA